MKLVTNVRVPIVNRMPRPKNEPQSQIGAVETSA